ncbi:hypothetical protein [Natrinema salaciae]|uniref:hypothetical protein n=1 Tax=Natrinema salaciae TaxID=1186196 RepID=UPI0015873CAD|nr:hypothetical protein [Natrinema salaciae]
MTFHGIHQCVPLLFTIGIEMDVPLSGIFALVREVGSDFMDGITETVEVRLEESPFFRLTLGGRLRQ